MNFFEEIFNLLEFNDKQKQKALSDIGILVQAKVTSELILQLPENILVEIEKIGVIESDIGQKKVTDILKKHFQIGKIKEEEKNAIGLVILIYLNYMFEDASSKDKGKLKQYFLGIAK